ncbi:MAG: GNAT family N-acetyltransferase [Clostridia bacterium]|nr:GNAT family N-acetyltransferase [Clostridia bacterium]
MTIREATNDDLKEIGKIYTDGWKETYRGLISDDYLNSLQYGDAEKKWADFIAEHLNAVFVAEAAGGVIGFAAGCPGADPESGELYALYVDKASKGIGTGGRLLTAVAEHFRERGMRSLVVWVMESNEKAVSYYKRRGAVCYTGRKHSFGDETVDDVCLAWRDIGLL